MARPTCWTTATGAAPATGCSICSIEQARNQLARLGFYVEGTSAMAVAAMTELSQALACALPGVLLTGNGLKTHRE